MAKRKKKTEPVDEAAVEHAIDEAAPPLEVEPRTQRCIVVRRASSIGKRQFRVGELLAVVDLEPGLSMNYVVDAVRDGLAGVE